MQVMFRVKDRLLLTSAPASVHNAQAGLEDWQDRQALKAVLATVFAGIGIWVWIDVAGIRDPEVVFSQRTAVIATIVMVVLFALWTLRELITSKTQQENLWRLYSHPGIRASRSLDIAILVLSVATFTYLALPILFSEFGSVADRAPKRSTSYLHERQIEAVKKKVLSQINEQEADRALRRIRMRGIERFLSTEIEKPLDAALDEITDATSAERLRATQRAIGRWLAMVTAAASIFLGAVPWMLQGYTDRGWRGVLVKSVDTLRLARVPLLALVAAFGLDRLGATATQPALWLFVFGGLALADGSIAAVVSRSPEKVFVTSRGSVFHSRLSCTRLARSDPASILAIPKASARQIHRKPCQACRNEGT
ncbi:MAG: hypothetical protein AAF481_10390 [Acidobacteriota bacterium]